MKNAVVSLKKLVSNKYAQAGAALAVSVPALAEDTNPNLAAIQKGIDSGKEMVSLTTSGIIAMAAISFGVGMVIMWLAKR